MQQFFSEVIRGPLSVLPVNTNDCVGADRIVPVPSSTPKGRAEPPYRLGSLVSVSPLMRSVFDLLQRLGPSDVTLTFAGETGSGKDVFANIVHELSARSAGPFVVFDCGAVAKNLIESELLGHERGSFTGAVNQHVGAFEQAHGGTLFLDEIGELPLDLQPRLLRVLESHRVRRVGGKQDRAVDCRVVAATNRDLPAEVAEGRFRQDLYFRLAGAVVPVPPLRSRLEDLPILVTRLLADLGRADVKPTPDVLAILSRNAWPGNVRELKNALACALAFVEGAVLEPRHLEFLAPQKGDDDAPGLERLPLGGKGLHEIERAAIKQTLDLSGGNKLHAARTLGIAVSTLYEKLKKHGL